MTPAKTGPPYVSEMTHGSAAAPGDAGSDPVSRGRKRKGHNPSLPRCVQPNGCNRGASPMGTAVGCRARRLNMKKFFSSNEQILPRPPEKLPNYADARARR